jgi:hypothetical protein
MTETGGGGSQFGDVGWEIALFARDLIDHFSAEPEPLGDGSQGMPEADCKALELWLDIDTEVPLIEVPYEVDGSVRQQAQDAIRDFHIALPYNEAERKWLIRLSSGRWGRKTEDMPRLLEMYEDRILMSGVQRVVSGRDLMRRWMAWRRETDEFEGSGALDQARQALAKIDELLS